MGSVDFTCCECGKGGGQGRFFETKCEANVVCKNADGSHSVESITGVYDGYGRIHANIDGKEPYVHAEGLSYDPPPREHDPYAPKDVVAYLDAKFKRDIIPVITFYVQEFAEHFEGWTQGDKDPSKNFVAFNVKCKQCCDSEFNMLPPVHTMETIADFNVRMAKTRTSATLRLAKSNIVRAQAEFDKVQARFNEVQTALTKDLATIEAKQKAFDCFDAAILLVDEERPSKRPRRG